MKTHLQCGIVRLLENYRDLIIILKLILAQSINKVLHQFFGNCSRLCSFEVMGKAALTARDSISLEGVLDKSRN